MRRVWVGLLLASGAVSAQINLGSLDGLAAKAKESVNLTLPKGLINIARPLVEKEGGPEAGTLLAGVNGISIRVFEFDGRGKYQMSDLDPIFAQLTTAAGWSKLVSVKDKDEIAEVYARMDQGRIVGVTIVAAEPNELAVVSIDGAIDLDALSKMRGLGLPDLSELLPKQPKGKEK